MFSISLMFGENIQGTEINPLDISDIKWVYLKFNADVNYADRGTDDIKIEVSNAKNVIRIKSDVVDFDSTTITVITNDGIVHTFALSYKQDPKAIAIKIKGGKITEDDYIETYHIELSDDRTSHVILPEKIVDISVGSNYIAAEQTEEISNIVKCKSINAGFDIYKETSLTIVTEKEIYPFIATYNKKPQQVNMTIGSSSHAVFNRIPTNESDMKSLGEQVLSQGSVINNIGVIEDKMTFSLRSIFIDNDIMMFNIGLQNASRIDYDIDFIKCYIVNKKTAKHETYQIDEKVPIFTYSNSENEMVKAKGTYNTVLFYNRFTIPDKHILYFEVFEKNGGRHLKFTIPHKELLKAKYLK